MLKKATSGWLGRWSVSPWLPIRNSHLKQLLSELPLSPTLSLGQLSYELPLLRVAASLSCPLSEQSFLCATSSWKLLWGTYFGHCLLCEQPLLFATPSVSYLFSALPLPSANSSLNYILTASPSHVFSELLLWATSSVQPFFSSLSASSAFSHHQLHSHRAQNWVTAKSLSSLAQQFHCVFPCSGCNSTKHGWDQIGHRPRKIELSLKLCLCAFSPPDLSRVVRDCSDLMWLYIFIRNELSVSCTFSQRLSQPELHRKNTKTPWRPPQKPAKRLCFRAIFAHFLPLSSSHLQTHVTVIPFFHYCDQNLSKKSGLQARMHCRAKLRQIETRTISCKHASFEENQFQESAITWGEFVMLPGRLQHQIWDWKQAIPKDVWRLYDLYVLDGTGEISMKSMRHSFMDLLRFPGLPALMELDAETCWSEYTLSSKRLQAKIHERTEERCIDDHHDLHGKELKTPGFAHYSPGSLKTLKYKLEMVSCNTSCPCPHYKMRFHQVAFWWEKARKPKQHCFNTSLSSNTMVYKNTFLNIPLFLATRFKLYREMTIRSRDFWVSRTTCDRGNRREDARKTVDDSNIKCNRSCLVHNVRHQSM